MNDRVVKNPKFKSNGEFHRSLAARGVGVKDYPNTHTEVEYLGNGKFAASIGVGHQVFFDKTDGNKPKKHKLTDNRPDHVLIQGAKCCVEVYPYYAKYFDVQHEEVRVEEERWVVQRLFREPDEWRDVDAYNPVISVEEYSEPAGDVVKVTVSYDTDYGPLTVEYFQRDGNNLKHNVTFENTSGSTETFRVLQRWAGIVGDRCNGKAPGDFITDSTLLTYAEVIAKIVTSQPESVLDVGGGRGKLARRLTERGLTATCMDASEEYWNDRVTDAYVRHDATVSPWPFSDKQFDLCTATGSLKYIPDEDVETVVHEIARISKRGLICVGGGIDRAPSDWDVVEIRRPPEWWIDKFNSLAPDYNVEAIELRVEPEVTCLNFHHADEARPSSIIENLSSMIVNLDGKMKVDECLQGFTVGTHTQGLKADFLYGIWVLAQNQQLEIDPDSSTLNDPTIDGFIRYRSPNYIRHAADAEIKFGKYDVEA